MDEPGDTHDHTAAGDPSDHHGARIGGGQECLACPVCVLLQALQTSRPEVVEHLIAASRELTLAMKAVIDAQATAHDRHTGGGLERIQVD